MIYYKFKPVFVSRSIQKIKKGIDAFNAIDAKCTFFRMRTDKPTPTMRQYGILLHLRRMALLRFDDKKTIFKLYTGNSTIPRFLVGRYVALHRGFELHEFRIRRGMVGFCFNDFIKTKVCGTRIHINNKIAKKKIRKLKQLMALVEQRFAKKRKKVITNKNKNKNKNKSKKK